MLEFSSFIEKLKKSYFLYNTVIFNKNTLLIIKYIQKKTFYPLVISRVCDKYFS